VPEDFCGPRPRGSRKSGTHIRAEVLDETQRCRVARLICVRHRYPFEVLSRLRRARVDREAALVSERSAQSARARAVEARARTLRRETEERIVQSYSAERERLQAGEVRAGELSQLGDWRRGAEAELQAKAELVQRASSALASELTAEAEARCALGVASIEASVIDRHRIDWQAERDAAHERAEEETVTEQWAAKRFPSRA
jgi:hypothetical protein